MTLKLINYKRKDMYNHLQMFGVKCQFSVRPIYSGYNIVH